VQQVNVCFLACGPVGIEITLDNHARICDRHRPQVGGECGGFSWSRATSGTAVEALQQPTSRSYLATGVSAGSAALDPTRAARHAR